MRKPMVTRTFETMVFEVMVVDVNTKTIGTTVCKLSRVINDHEKRTKAIKEMVENETTKFVMVTATKTETKLYGMSESDFLKYAIELDPTTRKALEVEEDEEDEEE